MIDTSLMIPTIAISFFILLMATFLLNPKDKKTTSSAHKSAQANIGDTYIDYLNHHTVYSDYSSVGDVGGHCGGDFGGGGDCGGS